MFRKNTNVSRLKHFPLFAVKGEENYYLAHFACVRKAVANKCPDYCLCQSVVTQIICCEEKINI